MSASMVDKHDLLVNMTPTSARKNKVIVVARETRSTFDPTVKTVTTALNFA